VSPASHMLRLRVRGTLFIRICYLPRSRRLFVRRQVALSQFRRRFRQMAMGALRQTDSFAARDEA